MKHFDQPTKLATTVISLEKALLNCSGLKVILGELSKYRPPACVDAKWADAKCVLTASGFFDSLLPKEWHGNKGLAIILPEELSAVLEEGVEQEPYCFNLQTTDLQQNHTYAIWTLGSGSGVVSIMLCNGAFHALIEDRRNGEIVPIMMLAGETVVLGGILLDDIFIGCFQASESSSGQNWRPLQMYSHEELELAAIEAERIGNFPWQASPLQEPMVFQFFEPKLFDFRNL